MKDVILFGFGKMGASIARGWMLKQLDFKIFIIEKESSLRKIANRDGFKAYENIESLNETQKLKNSAIIFLATNGETVKVFKVYIYKTVFISIDYFLV